MRCKHSTSEAVAFLLECTACRAGWLLLGFLLLGGVWACPLPAQIAIEKPPINYFSSDSIDPVAELSRQIEKKVVHLEFDERHGWLPSLLERLEISPDSQLLVFSKTSMQVNKISPRRPRAIYFNDDVYVGWVQHGNIEIAATDPQKGAVFYSVEQQSASLRIVADNGGCLTCHATHRTQGVPGYLVRSVFCDFNGWPRTGTRTYISDQTTQFHKRYGGWYVTGSHGDMRHMGNVIAADRSQPEFVDRQAGANRLQLDGILDTTDYLTGHSDLVALMILEHQSQMHNLMAVANFQTRIAEAEVATLRQNPIATGTGLANTAAAQRIDATVERLLRYLLFADEQRLTCPVAGSSGFADWFQARAAVEKQLDSHGRSLRDLDLVTRIFKYPCSYLIYSPAFDGLPSSVLERIQVRLSAILNAPAAPEGYEHLSDQDRRQIWEILRDTKPDFLM